MSETNQVTEQATTTTEGQAAPTATSTTTEGTQTQVVASEAKQQQATDGQNGNTSLLDDEPTKTEGETDKPKAETPKAPEKYEFKAPEGQDFDPDVIDAYSEIAKELDLPQEAAQKIIDKIAPVMAQKQERVMGEAVKAWTESSRADKEYGGEKFDENLGVAKKGLEFASPELRELLKATNLQHNPEVIRLFYRVGKAISEDRVIVGKPGNTKPSDPAKRMFPNMN